MFVPLLGKHEIRDAFLTTDAEPNLEDKRFSTMTLLSKKRFTYSLDANEKVDGSEDEEKFIIGQVFRQELPSATGRDGLCVDLIPPYARDSFLRIINVHLESRDAFSFRAQQLDQLASALHEPGCRGGLIIGYFNATSEDHQLIGANKLEDAWLRLHGDRAPDAPNWNVAMRDLNHEPRRLDKIAMVGLVPETMEVMHPSHVDSPRQGAISDQIQWSDHSGLRCDFCF